MLFVRRGGLNFLRNREFLAVPEGNLRMLVSWCFEFVGSFKSEQKRWLELSNSNKKKGDCKLGVAARCSMFNSCQLFVLLGLCVRL